MASAVCGGGQTGRQRGGGDARGGLEGRSASRLDRPRSSAGSDASGVAGSEGRRGALRSGGTDQTRGPRQGPPTQGMGGGRRAVTQCRDAGP